MIVKSMVGENNQMTAALQSRDVEQTFYVDRLIATANQIPNLKLVIIDPASRFRGGDENSALDTTIFVVAIERVAQATGANILIAHHSNKGAFNAIEQNQSASRGSSALTDGVRWQLNLMTFSEKEARHYGIPSEQKNLYLTAALTKSNYSPPHAPVILRRGDGGYLHHVNLVSHKETQTDDLKSRIIALVASELKAGRQFSKTGFAQQFGKKDGALQAGNNMVREVLDNLIDTGRLRVEQGKLALQKKAKISISHASCDITMNRDGKGPS
jgi:RecA-family ATPase